jgi:ADP-ribose diphosphatase
MEVDMINWQVVNNEVAFRAHTGLSVHKQKIQLPDGRKVSDFYQISMGDFVSIVAITKCQNVVVLRQYKHGVGRVAMTLPGGGIDVDEGPLEAAQRELLEETGFTADSWVPLGSFVLNGNQRIAQSHVFLATECNQIQPPAAGDLEEMQVITQPWNEVLTSLKENSFPIISHTTALSLAAIHGID